MGEWKSSVIAAGGKRAIVLLGVLYIGIGLGLAYIEVSGGTPYSNALIIAFFIGGPGLVLVFGGFRLTNTDINQQFYPTITGWCLSAIGIMMGLLLLYHFQPAATLNDPVRAILNLTAFVLVPAFVGGYHAAKAKTRAFELERYKTTIETVWDGVTTLDADNRFVMVNEAFCKMTGFERDEIIGEPSTEILTEPVFDEEGMLHELVAEGELDVTKLEYDLQTADGGSIPVEANFGPIQFEDGTVGGIGVIRDVSERTERETDLRNAKMQLESATEAAAVGTWEWHIKEDKMIMGPSFAKTFGVDPENAREGLPLDVFTSAIHDDDRDRVLTKVDDTLKRGGEYEAEYRVWNANDELRWVVARGQVECNEDGTPVRFPGAITDITERKRAELELQRTKDQLETLFDVLPVGVVVAEADGKIVEANDVAHSIWGGDVFDANSLDEYEAYPVRWADTGEHVPSEEMTLARVVAGEEVTEPDIFEIDTEDGERRIIEIVGRPIRNETGEVSLGVVTMSDVTERMKVQRQLVESEQRYRTLAEQFPDGAVGIYDHSLRHTLVAGDAVEGPLPSAEEIEGRPLAEIFPEDIVEDLEPILRAAVENGETGNMRSEFANRVWEVWATPLRDADDQIFAGMSFAQDVTERTEYERKLEASNERLEQFAYAASHDLQEPLRMISSYLQLIEHRYDDVLDEDGHEFIDFAVGGADRMRDMINGLLTYSRVDSQGAPFEEVDLDEMVSDACSDLAVQIDETDTSVNVETLPRVHGDKHQLRQLFQNLVRNAIQYCGDKPPRVHISAERESKGWKISVRDEGIGIEPSEQARIFEIFHRLHTYDDVDGSGIGLALCERITERHGGDIWVDSKPGEGSTFSFTLNASSP